MSTFSNAIRAILPAPCFERPFVCDGAPERCSVIVIGENPATTVDVDWWSFWDDATGCNYARWIESYRAARQAKGKRPKSNTRLRLDRLCEHSLRCLETNAFSNERLNGSGAGVANSDLLDLAVSTLPNISYVIVHGDKAARYIDSRTMPRSIRYVFRTRHFKIESYAVLDGVAHTILADQQDAGPAQQQSFLHQTTTVNRSERKS